MSKNLVLCLDGTGNEFGDANSNVVKLYSTLIHSDEQVCHYHPGLGTRGAPNALTKLAKFWTKLMGLAFGYGLSTDLADAYSFLMAEYEPGDRVYVFGFSRGAYTARALCGMLRMFGLLRRHEEVLIPYMIRMMGQLENREVFRIAAQFKYTFSRPCPTYFLGVWDTVSSVGWIHNPVKIPYTKNNEEIAIARHAISIDERRCFYRQNLLGDARPAQDFQQIWFAGVHSDIGGSYPETQSGLSKLTLQWMLDEARKAGLRVDAAKAWKILGELGPTALARPDATAMIHQSLHGIWWALEFLPKRHSVAPTTPGGRWARKWEVPLARPRRVPQDAVIHPTVEERMRKIPVYRPANLPPGTAVHSTKSMRWIAGGIAAAAAFSAVLLLKRR